MHASASSSSDATALQRNFSDCTVVTVVVAVCGIIAVTRANSCAASATVPKSATRAPFRKCIGGIAAAFAGFVIHAGQPGGGSLLIVVGSLVGASGLILTQIMCKAMNRSLANVLFGGIDAGADGGDTEYKGVKSTSGADVAMILESAQSVIIVPGYGMAVAQAQHKVQELAGVLEADDIEVRYAIHPVAGRMPGHMNVLLAEANVPYEQLFELDQINSEFKNTDVVIIIGANDVCNPVAYDEGSAIAGMPVLDVWDARTVIIVKRSLSAGYAGIKNPLFERDNALMFFADGKAAVEETISEYKDL